MRNYEGMVALPQIGAQYGQILQRNLYVVDRFLKQINVAGIPQGQPPRAGAAGGGHTPGCCPNEVDEFEGVNDATEGILSFGRADVAAEASDFDPDVHTFTRIEGFELNLINNAVGNDLVVGAVSVQTSVVYTGTYALQIAPAGAAAHYSFAWMLAGTDGQPTNASPPAAVSARFRMRFSSFPASTADIIDILGASTRSSIDLTSGGFLVLDGDTGTTQLALDTWYEIALIYDSAGSGAISLYIDREAEFLNVVPATAGTTTYLRFGSGATPTYTMFIDDICVEAASAVADISLPPPGRIYGIPLTGNGLLTGSFATVGAGSEWEACNKPHDGATSSINCSSPGVATQRKGFVHTPQSEITDNINSVQFCWSGISDSGGSFTIVGIVAETDSASSGDYTELTSGGSDSGSTYRLFGSIRPLSIWSGVRWTSGELALMAPGVRISLNANQVNTSTVCVQVDVEDLSFLTQEASFARAIRVTADEGYVIPANMVADDATLTTEDRGWLSLGWDGTLAHILLTDSSGRLQVAVASGGAPSETDDTAFTIGSDAVSPSGFLADDTTPDTVDEGDVGIARMDLSRRQLVRIVGATDSQRLDIDSSGRALVSLGADTLGFTLVDDATFTPATSRVTTVGFFADESSTDSVDEGDTGAARMTLDRKQIVTVRPHATGEALDTFRSIDLDETEEEVKASAGKVYGYSFTNLSASFLFVKFYNLTAADTDVGTDTPQLTIPVPPYSTVNISFDPGITFSTAISVACTTGVADADTGAPGANELVAAVFYK